MRIRLLLLLVSVFLVCSTLRADDLALIGAKIYPSPTDAPIENGSILIHDGLIVSVGPSASVKIPPNAAIIYVKGLVVTAGFWNSHVHILSPGRVPQVRFWNLGLGFSLL